MRLCMSLLCLLHSCEHPCAYACVVHVCEPAFSVHSAAILSISCGALTLSLAFQ